MTTDQAGTVTSNRPFTEWGSRANPAAPPFTAFGFTGEMHGDSGTGGLVYLRARWYNPTDGTFLTRDPFPGFAAVPYSQHPYQYGYSNPVSNTDPSGMCVDADGDGRCDRARDEPSPSTIDLPFVVPDRGSTNIHAANCTICDIAPYNGTNREFLDSRRHEKHTLFYPLEDIIVLWKDRFMSSTMM